MQISGGHLLAAGPDGGNTIISSNPLSSYLLMEKSIAAGIRRLSSIRFKKDPAETGVLFTTARKFKGLENKVIIITDIDETCFSNASIKKVFYVACSRATHHLSLMISGGPDKITATAAAIPGTGLSGKGKIVLKTKTKPAKI